MPICSVSSAEMLSYLFSIYALCRRGFQISENWWKKQMPRQSCHPGPLILKKINRTLSHRHEYRGQTVYAGVSQAIARKTNRMTYSTVFLPATRDHFSHSPPQSHRHTPPSVCDALFSHDSAFRMPGSTGGLGSGQLIKCDRQPPCWGSRPKAFQHLGKNKTEQEQSQVDLM